MPRRYTLVISDDPEELDTILSALVDPVSRRDVVVTGDAANALYVIFGIDGKGSKGRVQVPELVVVDVDAPRVRDLELPRLLKIDPRTEHVPIVALAGEVDDGILHDEGSLQCDWIVRKPCDVVLLSTAVVAAETRGYWSLAREIAAPDSWS